VVAQPVPAVSFAPLAARWRTFDEGDGGVYATSWRYRQNSLGWAASMPRGGIVVRVFFPGTAAPRPPLRLVLPAKPATLLDGTTDTPEYRLQGRVAGRDVEVWVDIRRARPTAADLRAASRAVSSIRFG
jgi:hypothetical protein